MPCKSNPLPSDLQSLLPLTPAVFFILFALADGHKHGYAIMQAVSTLSGEACRMGPGTLYTTLQRLLDLALIEETSGPPAASDRDSRRRYYRLTPNGKLLCEAEISRMESVVRLARRKHLVPRASE
jgi:DNA-binding PadR family transcriptional regulator